MYDKKPVPELTMPGWQFWETEADVMGVRMIRVAAHKNSDVEFHVTWTKEHDHEAMRRDALAALVLQVCLFVADPGRWYKSYWTAMQDRKHNYDAS